MGLHDGHRKRLKAQFLAHGEDFHDHQLLELLLCYAIPQGDVNELAHMLLGQFGSLAGVLDASPDDLRKVPGVGENTVVLLKLIPAIAARYLASRTSAEVILSDSATLHALFTPYFFGARNEKSFLACFDSKGKLLGVRPLSEGTPNANEISLRKITTEALALNATVVVLAHNHPSGVAVPSSSDEAATRQVAEALRTIGVRLVDHIVVADRDFVSMADSGDLLG